MTREHWIKAGIWLIPIIFAAGSLYYQQHRVAEQAATTDKELRAHESLQAHPVVNERVERLERDTTEMIKEQRVIRVEQNRAAENISAICQATNANCR